MPGSYRQGQRIDGGLVTDSDAKEILFLLTTGHEDLPRAELAFETALAAQASGIKVGISLLLQASSWACVPRRLGSERAYELLDQLIALGADVSCCSKCADQACTSDHGGRHNADANAATATSVINQSMRIAGLTSIVEVAVRGIPTVTF